MFVIRRFDAVLEPKHEAVMKVKEQFTKAGITELDAALASVAEQAFVNKSDFTLDDIFYADSKARQIVRESL